MAGAWEFFRGALHLGSPAHLEISLRRVQLCLVVYLCGVAALCMHEIAMRENLGLVELVLRLQRRAA